jgi:hypothetical protein
VLTWQYKPTRRRHTPLRAPASPNLLCLLLVRMRLLLLLLLLLLRQAGVVGLP